jgi:hypothetical protein
MAISREIVIDPADIRVSMQCETCNARVEISPSDIGREVQSDSRKLLVKPEIPNECPACGDNWSKFRDGVSRLFGAIGELEAYNVNLRVPEASARH